MRAMLSLSARAFLVARTRFGITASPAEATPAVRNWRRFIVYSPVSYECCIAFICGINQFRKKCCIPTIFGSYADITLQGLRVTSDGSNFQRLKIRHAQFGQLPVLLDKI